MEPVNAPARVRISQDAENREGAHLPHSGRYRRRDHVEAALSAVRFGPADDRPDRCDRTFMLCYNSVNVIIILKCYFPRLLINLKHKH